MSRHNLWNYNNNLHRTLFLKYEIKQTLLKSFRLNKNINFSKRYLAIFYLASIPKKSSITYIVYRCLRSGRTWSVGRKTGLSRFVLRKESYSANLPGLARASW